MGTAPPIVPGYDMLQPIIRFSHWHVYVENCSCLIEQHSWPMAVIRLNCACKCTHWLHWFSLLLPLHQRCTTVLLIESSFSLSQSRFFALAGFANASYMKPAHIPFIDLGKYCRNVDMTRRRISSHWNVYSDDAITLMCREGFVDHQNQAHLSLAC